MSIEVSDLSIHYIAGRKIVEQPAIENINFKIEPGEIFGILGPAGAGKTTLIYAIKGIIDKVIPASIKGKVVVNGVDIRKEKIENLARMVGIAFANPTYSTVAVTVEDDVAFGPSALGLPVDEVRERVDFALDACRLKGYEKRNTGELSGGETQALAIAGIIAMRPSIICLDEPISMLDPIGKEMTYSLVERLSKQYGITIVLTEAGMDTNYLAPIADRIAVINNGQILGLDEPRKIISNEKLLDEIKVVLPQLSDFFQRIGSKYVPLTVKGAAEYLVKQKKLEARVTKKPTRRVEVLRKAEPIVSVRNLRKYYETWTGYIKALDGVDLDLYPEEFIGIIGQNGSGKTTFCYHLVGLLRPTNKDAKVIVDGVDVTRTDVSKMISHINYCFQNPDSQLFQETVWNEVTFGLKIKGLSQNEIERIGTETLKLFGIEKLRDLEILSAPLHVKRFVSIASILCLQPKILLVDEPTNGLNYENSIKILDILHSFRDKMHMTIVVVSHSMEMVAKYAERVIVFSQGKVLLDGPTREVYSQHEMLRKSYLYPPPITRLGQALKDYGFTEDILSVDEMMEVSKIKK